jgi:homocitrate synthase NifV
VDRAADAGLGGQRGLRGRVARRPGFLVQAAQVAQATARCACAMPTRWACWTRSAPRARGALRREVDMDIEMHAHDDLGLATANTLAALRAGATHASTTVNGLGERAGNAALEEVVMAARHLLGIDCGIDTTALPAISRTGGAGLGPAGGGGQEHRRRRRCSRTSRASTSTAC